MLMEFIFPLIWMLVVDFSIDETTMRFKGHHAKKDDIHRKILWIKDIKYFSESTHI